MKKKLRLLIVANNSKWVTKHVHSLQEWFDTKVELTIDVEHTNYVNIPFAEAVTVNRLDGQPGNEPSAEGYFAVDPEWYDKYVTAGAIGLYDLVLLVLPTSQWMEKNRARGWRTGRDQGPVEMQIACDENEHYYLPPNSQDAGPAFLQLARHEILHALFLLTGQFDTTHKWWNEGMQLERALDEVQFPIPNEAEELSRLQRILLLAREVLRLIGILRRETPQPIPEPDGPLPQTPPRRARFEDFCDAIEDFEDYVPPGGRYRDGSIATLGSISWRNKNPGNLKYVGQAKAIGKDKHGHATFATYGDGRAALEHMIRNAIAGRSTVYRPDMTFAQFFSKYAEANSAQYAMFVSEKCGVPMTTRLVELVLQ